MSGYIGDFPVNHTAVTDAFGTYAAATGAPTATTNVAAGDVVIYKDGGTTQRTSSAGITVSTSFDGVTGIQMIVIDLSDNTDAGFYAAGHEYSVIVGPITADTQTLYFPAFSFSIQRAGGALATLLTAETAENIAAAIWDLARAGHSTAGTFGAGVLLAADQAVNLTKVNGSAISNLISGRIDANAQVVGTGAIVAGSFGAGAVDAAAIAADAIGSSELAATAATEIATAVFARAFSAAYGSLTFDQLVSLMASVLLSKCSGMGTATGVFRNIADSGDTVSATIDASGNRTAVTLTP